ncbi:beach-domain-containing protein [Ascodesmis nigricans]|uniref:Beach-domain-containing protein n=1 Tax=Ascodesmis nigricans TaxID=341454 RepID=A0A4S2MMF6_9PEZI|nr:beach-domain-containing protein [Ascodesmis nigricans]
MPVMASSSSSSSTSVRRRLSSAAANRQPKFLTELQPLLDSLDSSVSSPDILERLQWLSLLKRVLIDAPEAKDTFRALKGFSTLLSTLHSFAGFYNSSSRSEEEKFHFVELVKCLFAVISEALQDHPGNRRFFSHRIGWPNLEQALAATGLPTEAPDHLFGVLLAFAMDDATLASLITSTKKALEVRRDKAGTDLAEDEILDFVRERMSTQFCSKDLLLNPEVMPLVISFQIAMSSGSESVICSMVALQALLAIARASKHNLVALHGTKILSSLLPRIWNKDILASEQVVVRDLCQHLLELGINHLSDAHELYSRAVDDEGAAQFLLDGIISSRQPPHIQFDLSINGYSAMELSTLGRTFPPTSSAGYTFSAWIHIDHWDPTAHTTIFGAFDDSQRCFVLGYIERDTQKFILQTSLSSPRASVRFKTTVFQPHRWYHIAIVHRRSRATSSAKAALYVDGEFVEQIKAPYPQSPPSSNPSVQVFLGTPSQLTAQVGRGVVNDCWSIGAAHIFEDVLSDDLIAVYYRLGPRYSGNFQDTLGSFQTYEASAALNMRNELIHPGREEKSDIIAAIRNKASGILPESKILMSISATQVLNDSDENNMDESMLVQSLSKQAAVNLRVHTRSKKIVINGAVPSIKEALVTPHGIGFLTGDPVVVVPQSLDDAAWRICGAAAIGLKIVEAAKTLSQLCRAVRILFELIKHSWRNSEAMEKENGFTVLSYLIKQKGSTMVIGKELLDLILEFVGYQRDAPEESFIINPLAYRVLLVDSDIWRKADLETQKTYFSQFITFVSGSKFHHFNSKRLTRMRIVRKLLFALKGEAFSREIIPDFLDAFKVLVKSNLSADVLRSISLFITYSMHKHNPNRPLRVKKSNVNLRRPGLTTTTTKILTTSAALASELPEGSGFTRQELGVKVLQMFHDVLCEDGHGTANIKKFAKTVTNKWLLYLLAENDPDVVVLGTKLIARLLIVHGGSYVSKFATKTGGFVIMRHRLKRWWNLAPLWPICFCILFGKDVAKVDVDRPLVFSELVKMFEDGARKEKGIVVYPEIWPVIMGMLKAGVATVVAELGDGGEKDPMSPAQKGHARTRSTLLNDPIPPGGKPTDKTMSELTRMLQTIVQFLAQLHCTSAQFREFCTTPSFLQPFFSVLFPVICSSDHVSAEIELNSRDSALTFDGGDVVIRPLVSNAGQSAPIIRTVAVEDRPLSPGGTRPKRLRKASSFILVSKEMEASAPTPSPAKLKTGVGEGLTKVEIKGLGGTSSLVESLMELVTSVFLNVLLEKRDFQGFALNTKVPPGFQEHQIFFETYLLRNTLSHLTTFISLDMAKLTQPKILTNLARYAVYMTDSLYEGWFLNGAEALFEFIGTILEHLQLPNVANLKAVRLCSKSVEVLRTSLSRVVLFRLVELEGPEGRERLQGKEPRQEVVRFVEKMMYWQTVLLSQENKDADFTRLCCYLLYGWLKEESEVRMAAVNMLRFVMMQKPAEIATLFNRGKPEHQMLSEGFEKLQQEDNDSWLRWVDSHRKELESFFYGSLSKIWEAFVAEENRRTDETTKTRVSKRRETLKQWITEDVNNEDIFGRHESVSTNWSANIYASEHLKYQRAAQDQQDSVSYTVSQYAKLEAELTRPCGLLDSGEEMKWRLDPTEGRNRMRKRMLPDRRGHLHNYQPKRRMTGPGPQSSAVSTRPHALSVDGDEISIMTKGDADSVSQHGDTARDGGEPEMDDDYELVDDPREDDDGWEDKNRKVMRNLQHGDVVEFVHNVSRLIGLDAVEGLLILGKNYLYLIDNFFQRADGEIVNVWQAPKDERDQYLQLIAGRENGEKPQNPAAGGQAEHDSRSWPFEELVSISKRRFLFRDVALELFFADGRSYLLTTMSVADRDFLHSKLLAKATNANNNTTSPWAGDVWKVEALRTQDQPTNIGSRLANVFTPGSQNPATKKWIKGEISNFHYLMLVNTMAGRTFNDLTQYPVFPWVLADYTSEELDLTNPRTFRDLSKPMGAQTLERMEGFRERYRQFEEIQEAEQPPFHYGTHFSSAMIVCSYLIRLQPFVQSYLILQGGAFDHADRLFHSIEKAWNSASRDNMADVRELIPEFFFLPEFLVNSNNYNFGMRQNTNEQISDVILPPWAKGDPKVFIAKHREALESEYVSQHLNEWIDLVFGFKQRGEAAKEATNVYHHLSYHGAVELDGITDHVEKVAKIGIIHNFGQTPHQVFSRPHPVREVTGVEGERARALDVAAETLARLPFAIMDHGEKITMLTYSANHDRLFSSPPTRLSIPPNMSTYLSWGFADNSIRIYSAESQRLLSLHEHLHTSTITCALLPDPKTLITASADGTISIWSLHPSSSSSSSSHHHHHHHHSSNKTALEITHKASLFAHTTSVSHLAASRSFSTLVTADTAGRVVVWDLNRLRFVRTLPSKGRVTAIAVNDVTADIVVWTRRVATVFTVNGEVVVRTEVPVEVGEVSCVGWWEGEGNEWLRRMVMVTGHKTGRVGVWSLEVAEKGMGDSTRDVDARDGVGGINGTGTTATTNATTPPVSTVSATSAQLTSSTPSLSFSSLSSSLSASLSTTLQLPLRSRSNSSATTLTGTSLTRTRAHSAASLAPSIPPSSSFPPASSSFNASSSNSNSSNSKWCLHLIKILNHDFRPGENTFGSMHPSVSGLGNLGAGGAGNGGNGMGRWPPVTAVLPGRGMVVSADEVGRVLQWECGGRVR